MATTKNEIKKEKNNVFFNKEIFLRKSVINQSPIPFDISIYSDPLNRLTNKIEQIKLQVSLLIRQNPLLFLLKNILF